MINVSFLTKTHQYFSCMFIDVFFDEELENDDKMREKRFFKAIKLKNPLFFTIFIKKEPLKSFVFIFEF